MEKITVKKLTNRHVDKVILRSVVISICIVQVEIDGVLHQVVDEKGRVFRFNGPEHANNMLARMSADKAVLVHQSPYAEMAGQPEGEPPPPLEVNFNWRSDRDAS